MEELREEHGQSVSEIASLCEVSRHTAARLFSGERIQWSTARKFFENLRITDIRPYMIRDEGSVTDKSFEELDATLLREWRIESVTTKPHVMANGLKFRTCKLSHSLLPQEFARGKCYDLTDLRTRDQARVQEQLLRHPLVCRRLGKSPGFPTNERVAFSDDRSRFWVIDRWVDGPTLRDRLSYGELSGPQLARTMKQVLERLDALHQQRIIRRALSPDYIVLDQPDGDVFFTELELAKLLQGTRSVSEAWEDSPFLAPEIDGPEIDETVDYYSWAQILLYSATGRVPPSPADPAIAADASLPNRVCSIVERCLSISHKWRPHSASEIQRELVEWN